MANLSTTIFMDLKISAFTEQDVVKAFNKWMDDYINNPNGFKATSDSAMEHLKEKLNGEEPSYGEACYATLVEYLKEGNV